MKCPHCLDSFHEEWESTFINQNRYEGIIWTVRSCICPECKRTIIELLADNAPQDYVYPKQIARLKLSETIPEEYREDYYEACNVIHQSPKSSAAMSRHCLEKLLTAQESLESPTLEEKIKIVIKDKIFPKYIADNIDAVRAVGNFAVHPIKSTSSGTIVQVEPGEAELLLDTIEYLLNFYFVQPAEAQKKRESINAKLISAGKPTLKTQQ